MKIKKNNTELKKKIFLLQKRKCDQYSSDNDENQSYDFYVNMSDPNLAWTPMKVYFS